MSDMFADHVIRGRETEVDKRIAELKAENARLRAQVDEITRDRNYWRSVAEDPGLYWGDDDPPYRLPGS